jgi:hypothetical protein
MFARTNQIGLKTLSGKNHERYFFQGPEVEA